MAELNGLSTLRSVNGCRADNHTGRLGFVEVELDEVVVLSLYREARCERSSVLLGLDLFVALCNQIQLPPEATSLPKGTSRISTSRHVELTLNQISKLPLKTEKFVKLRSYHSQNELISSQNTNLRWFWPNLSGSPSSCSGLSYRYTMQQSNLRRCRETLSPAITD